MCHETVTQYLRVGNERTLYNNCQETAKKGAPSVISLLSEQKFTSVVVKKVNPDNQKEEETVVLVAMANMKLCSFVLLFSVY